MKFNFLKILFIFSLILTGLHCSSNNEDTSKNSEEVSESLIPIPHRLGDLKDQKIYIEQNVIDNSSNNTLAKKTRFLNLLTSSGSEEEFILQWKDPENDAEIIGESILENPDGELQLSSSTQSSNITLPIFWPQGQLYLGNSSALWISQAGFKNLLEKQNIGLNTGLVGRGMIGPVDTSPELVTAIAWLRDQATERQKQNPAEVTIFHISNRPKYLLKKSNKSIESIQVKNWLASMEIQKNPKNPLILSFVLRPDASVAEILFSPLRILKPALEYQVVGLDS